MRQVRLPPRKSPSQRTNDSSNALIVHGGHREPSRLSAAYPSVNDVSDGDALPVNKPFAERRDYRSWTPRSNGPRPWMHVTLPDIDLVPLTDSEYEAWLERATAEYAAEHVRTGNWSKEESIERAAEQMAQLLPDGPRTPGQFLWTIRPADGEPVGLLWVGTERRPGHAFIYDIEMVEHRRGEGFGTAALLGLEEWARERGITTIGLHVFGHNTGAWRLYRRLGYVETNVNMEKHL